MRCSGAVECRFEIADRRVVGRFVGPLLPAHGWHLAGPELPDDLLPLVLMLGHVGRYQVEREAALLLFLVMARHAVLFNEREVRSAGGERAEGAEGAGGAADAIGAWRASSDNTTPMAASRVATTAEINAVLGFHARICVIIRARPAGVEPRRRRGDDRREPRWTYRAVTRTTCAGTNPPLTPLHANTARS